MKKKEIEFPSCWEELVPWEWVKLLELRHKLMTQRGAFPCASTRPGTCCRSGKDCAARRATAGT